MTLKLFKTIDYSMTQTTQYFTHLPTMPYLSLKSHNNNGK